MMLLQLLEDGPTTVGIFRRSPNARAMRELRIKLDQEEEVDFKECSVFVTAALIKDFLRWICKEIVWKRSWIKSKAIKSRKDLTDWLRSWRFGQVLHNSSVDSWQIWTCRYIFFEPLNYFYVSIVIVIPNIRKVSISIGINCKNLQLYK